VSSDPLTSYVARLFASIGRSHPAKVVMVGYLMYIVTGWIALCLPLSSGSEVSVLDSLFIATSAVSTTGLVTVNIADAYSVIGQIIILLLIQVGGIGYMTFGSFLVLSRSSELSAQREEISRTVFALPESFRVDKFIRSVITFTAAIELSGVFALYFIFRAAGTPQPLWSAIFHSVSAFCTAGFGLYSNSFSDFAGNFWLNSVIGILSYLGAIGFIVCVDYWRKFRGKVAQVTLTSRIIVHSTIWLSVIGTILIFFGEPTVQKLAINDRILASGFQAMTAITTVGFNTIDTGALCNASLLVVIMLMVIGASPSGTGGGLKSTTFSALFGVMRSSARGENEVTFWGRVIPFSRIWTAVASMSFYVTALVIGCYLIELTESNNFVSNVFEVASALGTVGLSTGITAGLSALGKLILIAMMYCGRLGPLTFGIALFHRDARKEPASDSDLAV
jgi:trk system potassium uptake protein TrkH